MVAHRRAGKTVASIADLVLMAAVCRKPDGRFAFIAPLFNQAKDVAWPYLLRLTADLAPAINESELRVDLSNGARVRLYGADNYERLRGGYFDGLVLDEYGDMDPRAWAEVLRPALADREGWAIFIGTPKGRNHFCEIWESNADRDDWFRLMLKASETQLIPERELVDSRRSMSEDQYAQEYECSFEAAIIGSYYGRLLADLVERKRIASVSWDPAIPVVTAWDLGIGDSTSIWFCQQVANEIRLIDYYEASGEGMAHYAKMLAAKPYMYREHIVPHDADARLQDEHGRTRREILDGLGVKTRVLAPNNPADGIEAVRVTLPRCWFDAVKCARGIEALRQYRKDWDEKLKTFRDRPKHDWTSHACLTGDALIEIDRGLVPICDVHVGDMAKTPNGWASITAAGPVKRAAELIEVQLADGRWLRGTPEHRIFTERGLLKMDALRYSDEILSEGSSTWQSALSYSRAGNTGFRAAIIDIGIGQNRGLRTCIERFGSIIAGQFRAALMSIIAMAMAPITGFQTLNWSSVQSISDNMDWRTIRQANCDRLENWRVSALPNGIARRKGSGGMSDMASGHGKRESGSCVNARNAGVPSDHLSRRGPNSVTSIARWQLSEGGVASPLVYDLTVEKHHCYVANGILVSNSDAFRYLAVGITEARPVRKLRAVGSGSWMGS
jgi:hypothetical protein